MRVALQAIGVPLLSGYRHPPRSTAQELERAQEEEKQTPEAIAAAEEAAARRGGASRSRGRGGLRAATQGPQLRMRIGPDATEDTSLADTLPAKTAPRRDAPHGSLFAAQLARATRPL